MMVFQNRDAEQDQQVTQEQVIKGPKKNKKGSIRSSYQESKVTQETVTTDVRHDQKGYTGQCYHGSKTQEGNTGGYQK